LSGIVGGIILKLFDWATVSIAAGLAYFFGIKKLLKERELSRQESKLSRQENELSRKIDLYRQLVQDLTIVPELDKYKKEEKEELRKKLNRHVFELLQFAPDHIYREYKDVISGIKNGASAAPLYEFMITLRKELIPDTTLKVEEIVEIERIE